MKCAFLVSVIFAALIVISPPPALAQSSSIPLSPNRSSESQYLFRIGRQAFRHRNYQDAQTCFAAYLKDNPHDADALFFAGLTAIALKQYDDAIGYLKAAIKNRPPLWAARANLVVVYAMQGKWKEFDAERKFIQDARKSGAPGLSPTSSELIDVIQIGKERYMVHGYTPLVGRRKARYNFAHVGSDGKVDYWISCDSLDADQVYFAEKHPKEAAEGGRSFALDYFTSVRPRADGKGYTQTQGSIKFYPDGEPTYETVRTDVIEWLKHRTAPMAATTLTKPDATVNRASPVQAGQH